MRARRLVLCGIAAAGLVASAVADIPAASAQSASGTSTLEKLSFWKRHKLAEAVYAEADLTGAGDVYWTTQHFNAQARALYDRVGRETPFIKYSRG